MSGEEKLEHGINNASMCFNFATLFIALVKSKIYCIN